MPNWKTSEVNIDYLLKSGLLFEINRSILHLFGIAMTVRVDENNIKSLAFKDMRDKPEELTFDKNTFELGKSKLKSFLEEFGYSQDNRRIEKLGWGVQNFANNK